MEGKDFETEGTKVPFEELAKDHHFFDSIKTWKESRKDENGWAYESRVAIEFIKAMTSLAHELNTRKINNDIYETFFLEVIDKIKSLLNE